MKQEYGIEQRLYTLSPELHKRYQGCLVVSEAMLNKYQHIFPFYTDHTILHSMDVLAFSNALIGSQIDKLTDADLYVLMMGALFHDIGMGVSQGDFESFSSVLSLPSASNDEERAEIIRNNHQELSGLFIKKYGHLFDIPNDKYLYAIIQVSRGHRRTNLMDEKEYPTSFMVDEGRKVCLPYLASLICLADELDIARDRNISLLYDINKITNEISHMEFEKHEAITRVDVEKDRVVVYAVSRDPVVRRELGILIEKLEKKLLFCKKATDEHTPFTITQKRVILKLEPDLTEEDS